MQRAIAFLFPWRKTFRRLELQKRWGHRLAVVVFFGALIALFLCSWIVAEFGLAPVITYEGNIQYWEIVPAPPSGFTMDWDVTPVTSPPDLNAIGQGRVAVPMKDVFDKAAAEVKHSEILKTIEMPDGKTARYPGTTADETINAAWHHEEFADEARNALLGFGGAMLVAMIFSYLLQAAYRALLYVIFGAKAGNMPQNPRAAQ